MEWTFLPFESFEIMSVLKSLTSNRYKSWNWKGNHLPKLCKTAPTMNIVIAAKTAEPHPKIPEAIYTMAQKIIFIISNLFPDFKPTLNRGWGRGRSAGVNRGMQFCWSVKIYKPNPPWKFCRNPGKIFLLHARSKMRAQNVDESAIRYNCRIGKSVEISLWIRNPGNNDFKIRRSVRLFTPLLNFLAMILFAW